MPNRTCVAPDPIISGGSEGRWATRGSAVHKEAGAHWECRDELAARRDYSPREVRERRAFLRQIAASSALDRNPLSA